jgi:hypothetical protein
MVQPIELTIGGISLSSSLYMYQKSLKHLFGSSLFMLLENIRILCISHNKYGVAKESYCAWGFMFVLKGIFYNKVWVIL